MAHPPNFPPIFIGSLVPVKTALLSGSCRLSVCLNSGIVSPPISTETSALGGAIALKQRISPGSREMGLEGVKDSGTNAIPSGIGG